ncbi:MAG: MBL fold metallo-hydrolase [Pseudomonadota bacterium]
MSYRLTILGCGSSGGVPRIGADWGQCDPSNAKNRRRRCSALIDRTGERGRTRVLIDAGPDVREQLLDANVGALHGLLYTHDHADHTHGIDDLRVLVYRMKRRLNVWFDGPTRETLYQRFGYCFERPPGADYPPILDGNDLTYGVPIDVDGPGGTVSALPVRQDHGGISSVGYRIRDVAYSPDISNLPDESLELLQGLDVWIVDALRYVPHPSHFTVKQAVAWVERLKPKRAVLTHLHVDLDYEALRRELPDNVEPAYDGMVIDFA